MSSIDTDKHSKINNSAIGTWAGYIYQGLCALYHVLALIYDKDNKSIDYTNYTLYLDSYEDFSIHDEHDMAKSLHQCKNKKNLQTIDEDIQLMIDKKKHFINNEICSDDCLLYFHTNHKVTDLNKDVNLYKYNGKDTCSSGEILNYIKTIINDINKKEKVSSNATLIQARLIKIIDNKILEIHEESFNSTHKEPLYKLAKEKWCGIKFSEIIDIVHSNGFDNTLTDEELSILIRNKYISTSQDILCKYADCDEINEIDLLKVDVFTKAIKKMDSESFLKLVQRLNPHVTVNYTIDEISNIINYNSISFLIEVIGNINKDLDNKNISWDIENKNYSPTAIKDNREKSICHDIYKNKANLSFIWEFDWLVASITRTIENIEKEIHNIIKTEEKKDNDDNNIFKEKAIGLIKIDDVNEKLKRTC